MKLRRRAIRIPHLCALLVCAAALADVGCGDGRKLGADCSASGECASGRCLDGNCSTRCSDDSDCQSTVTELHCGIGSDGSHSCVPRCGVAGYACEGGIPVHCSQASTDSCRTCGCDAAGTYCKGSTNTCMPLEAEGGPCEWNDECLSGNCSNLSHVCRVPVGDACTTSNCDFCRTRSGVGSYCSRECDSGQDCGGDLCVGNASIYLFYCTSQCSPTNTSACPNQCDYLSGGGGYFCDCESPDCGGTFAAAPVGSICRADSMCTSGNCWDRVGIRSNGYTKYVGWCTQTCASDSECPAETACVNVDCNQAGGCKAICVPRCTSGGICDLDSASYCSDMPNVSGVGTTAVCTIRELNGGTCYGDSDCQSANCNQFGKCE